MTRRDDLMKFYLTLLEMLHDKSQQETTVKIIALLHIHTSVEYIYISTDDKLIIAL